MTWTPFIPDSSRTTPPNSWIHYQHSTLRHWPSLPRMWWKFLKRPGRAAHQTSSLDTVHKHLEHPARLMFADFSSAFNTLQPHQALLTRLPRRPAYPAATGLSNQQDTETLSGLQYISTSSPQGCVLSPLLFTLYTDDCRSTHPNHHLVKYANNTVLVSLSQYDRAEQSHCATI